MCAKLVANDETIKLPLRSVQFQWMQRILCICLLEHFHRRRRWQCLISSTQLRYFVLNSDACVPYMIVTFFPDVELLCDTNIAVWMPILSYEFWRRKVERKINALLHPEIESWMPRLRVNHSSTTCNPNRQGSMSRLNQAFIFLSSGRAKISSLKLTKYSWLKFIRA